MFNHVPPRRRRWPKKTKQPYYRKEKPQHAPRDCYDKVSIVVAILGLLVVFVYTGVSAYQAYLTYGLLEQTRQDRRPWVLAPDVSPTIENGVASFGLSFRNVGKTPTTSLYVGATKILHDTNLVKIVAATCADGNKAIGDGHKMNGRYSISPGGSFNINNVPPFVQTSFNVSEVEKSFDPFLVGCVVYGSSFDKGLRQTGFIVHLHVGKRAIQVPITETIDAN